MNRPLATLGCLGMLSASIAACSTPEPPAPSKPPPPAPTTNPPPVPSSASVSAAQLEAWSLACDGAALVQAGPQAVAAAQASSDSAPDLPSAQLLAYWESARSFDATGHLEDAAVDGLLERVATQLGTPAPAWWAEHLRSALRRDGQEPPYYDVKSSADADRGGPWRTENGVRLRGTPPAPLMVDEERTLSYDFSMDRAILAKSVKAGHMIEYARPRAGTTIYFASFDPTSGGFPFPLVAANVDGTQSWSTTACGPKRAVLGGLGHLMVEVRVLQDPPPAAAAGTLRPGGTPRGIAVFSAETHGAALEVFDPGTGKRTLAWSSDLWFARPSAGTP